MAKIFNGKVVSTKMTDTVVVEVERAYKHPRLHKVIRRHKKYKAHLDANIQPQEGDVVDIEETKPMSKEKRFKVIKIYNT